MCAIPEEDRAVVVVDVPAQGGRHREAMKEVDALRDVLAEKRAEVIAVHGRREMEQVMRAKVERDIAGRTSRIA